MAADKEGMMDFHEVANIFPLMTGFEFDSLVADIKAHGLREAIYTYKGKIIDGRNRYNACAKAKVKPTYVAWDEEGSLISFVVSQNIHRRHLDASQRGILAAKLSGKIAQENGKSDYTSPEKGSAQICAAESATDQAAAIANVSPRTVNMAASVLSEGAPELVAAVEAGDVSVSDAAKIVDKPKAAQRKAVSAVKRGKAKTVAAAASTPEDKPKAESVDADGKEIPAALRPAFDTRTEFRSLVSSLGKIVTRVEELSKGAGGAFVAERRQAFDADIKNAQRAIKFSMPHKVCPYCHGKGCKDTKGKNPCRGTGWTVKGVQGADE